MTRRVISAVVLAAVAAASATAPVAAADDFTLPFHNPSTVLS